MKRWLRIVIAVAVVALLIGAYFVVQAVQEQRRESELAESRPERPTLLELEQEKIEKIVLRGAERELVLNRTDDGFVPETPYDLRLNGNRVQQIVRNASTLRASRELEGELEELSHYGLGESAATAEVHLSSGETRRVRIGSPTPTRSGYYAQPEGDSSVYVISSFSGRALTSRIDDIRDRSLPSIDKKKVATVELVTPERTVRIEPVEPGDGILTSFTTYKMTEPFLRNRAVAADRFQKLLEQLPDFSINRFVAERPENLAQYGLAAPQRELHLTDKDGNELHLLFGSESEQGDVYAKLPELPHVFTVAASLDFLSHSAFDLTDKFVLIINIKNVTGFRVSTPEASYRGRLERTGTSGEDEEAQVSYFFEGQEVEEDHFKTFYQEIIGLTADSARPDPVRREPSQDEVELRIQYTLTGMDVEQLSAEFVEYDRNFYAVFRDGASEFLVSKHRIERMLEIAAEFAAGNPPE